MDSSDKVSLVNVNLMAYPSLKENTLKLHVGLSGGYDLGDKYDIAIKEITQSGDISELNEKEIQSKLSDTNWVPLKIENSRGDEIWVKINRSSLKEKFHISESELNRNQSSQKLVDLIKIKVQRSLIEKEILQNNLNNLKEKLASSSELKITDLLSDLHRLAEESDDEDLTSSLKNFLNEIEYLDNKNLREKESGNHFYSPVLEEHSHTFENRVLAQILVLEKAISSDFPKEEVFKTVNEKMKAELITQQKNLGLDKRIFNDIVAYPLMLDFLDNYDIEDLKKIRECFHAAKNQISGSFKDYSSVEVNFINHNFDSMISSIDLAINRNESEVRERVIEEAKAKMVKNYFPKIDSELSKSDLVSILAFLSTPVLDNLQLNKFSNSQLEEARSIIDRNMRGEIRGWLLTTNRKNYDFYMVPPGRMLERLDSTLKSREVESKQIDVKEISGLKVNSKNFEGKLKSFINVIKKTFVYYVFVAPAVKKCVRDHIALKNSAQLSDVYVTQSPQILSEIRKNLDGKNSSILKQFDDETISRIVDDNFLKEANLQLSDHKEPLWDEKKVRKLNISRAIQDLKNHPSNVNEDHLLNRINPLEIPFSELALIPLTDENSKALIEIWKSSLGNLYAKGRLDSLYSENDKRGVIIQSQYASQYLQAYQSMPWQIKGNLNNFLIEMNKSNQLDKITDFVVRHSGQLGDVPFDDPNLEKLQAEQKIYNEKIYPLINEMITKKTSANDVMGLIKVYTAFENEVMAIQHLINDIHSKLSEEEKINFDRTRLSNLIAQEIESVAVLDYHFTSAQINNLTKFREDVFNLWDDFYDFKNDLYDAETVEDVYNLLKFDDFYLGNNLEKIAPSRFPPMVIGETTYLEELERQLAVQRLVVAQEKFLKLSANLSPNKLTKEQRQAIGNFAYNLNEQVQDGQAYLETASSNRGILALASKRYEAGNYYIEKLLFDPNVMQDIDNGENYSLFKPDEQKGIIGLQELIDKNKVNMTFKDVDKESNVRRITKEEVIESSNFLENLIKNPGLYKILESFSPKEGDNPEAYLRYIPTFLHGQAKKMMKIENPNPVNKIPAGISKDTIEFIKDYSYRLNKISKIGKALIEVQKKADILLEKYKQDPLSILPADKLTLREIGLLSTAERLNSEDVNGDTFIKALKGMELYENNPQLKDFFEKTEKSAKILKQIDLIIKPAINKHYEISDIVAYNNTKTMKWKDKPSAFEVTWTARITDDYTHGAKLYRDKEGDIMTSHIIGGMINDDFDLYRMCISDVWKLDLAPLLPKTLEPTMQTVFGPEWSKNINDRYRKIENDLQLKAEEKNKFGKVRNEADRRVRAGFANYASVVNLVRGEPIKGHSREYNRDLQKLHSKFFDEQQYEEKQICSEFVSKVTVVSMIELNRQLSKDLLEKLGDRFDNSKILTDLKSKGIEIRPEVASYAEGTRLYKEQSSITQVAEKRWSKFLKANGYSSEEAEIAIRIGNKEILDLPYSKKERFKAIHPGRMVSLLVEKKCASRRELPTAASALFAIDEAKD